MIETPDPRVLQLRRDFDGSFAEEPVIAILAGEALLTLTVCGQAYAMRAAEVSSLARDRRIAPLPQAPASFIGLSGLRGSLLPVWDLAALLDLGRAPSAPWLITVQGEPAWALAFERFDGYLDQPAEGFCRYASQGAVAAFAQQAALGPQGLRPILELTLLRKAILALSPPQPPRRER